MGFLVAGYWDVGDYICLSRNVDFVPWVPGFTASIYGMRPLCKVFLPWVKFVFIHYVSAPF